MPTSVNAQSASQLSIVADDMPGMDGPELHRHLVACHFQIPVIFLTVGLIRSNSNLVSWPGAAEILTKPVDSAALQKAIETAVTRFHSYQTRPYKIASPKTPTNPVIASSIETL